VNTERYWTEARDYCSHHGGRLVKIDSAETNQFIVSTLNKLTWHSSGVWIGLNDMGTELTFKWHAGTNEPQEPLQWTNWGSGHPKAFLHNMRDCVRMVRRDTWKWHETPCNSLKWHYNFICQYKLKPDKISVNTATHLGVPPPVDSSNRKRNMDHVTETLATPIVVQTSMKDDQDVATVTPLVEDDSNIMAAAMEMNQNKQVQHSKTNSIVIAITVSTCVIAVLILILFILRRKRNNSLKLSTMEMNEEDEKSPEEKWILGEKAPVEKEKQFWTRFVPGKNPKTIVKTTAAQNMYVYAPGDGRCAVETSRRRHQELPQIPVLSDYLTMAGTTYSKVEDNRKSDVYTAMSDEHKEVYENDESEKKVYENNDGLNELSSPEKEVDDDCGMSGYDMPKQTNIYAEIPEQMRNEDDSHVYECLDEMKLKAKKAQDESANVEC